MKKIYIFGMGQGKTFVDRCLIKDGIEILGVIDNFKVGIMDETEGIPIISQSQLSDGYDYIVVSLMRYEDTRHELMMQGVNSDKIICFFDFTHAEKEAYWSVLDSYKWRLELMWKHYRNVTMPTLDNLMYEIYAESEAIQRQLPRIVDAEKTAEILRNERKCLARFGDGEFGFIYGRQRTKFQDIDYKLGERLREVLRVPNDNLLIAIANNYGRLDQYTDQAAEDIRSYMSRAVRKEHMKLLDLDREYYDAYISRPYMMYRDKEAAGRRFDSIRKIWGDESLLIVEGEHTRFGVGNDLLDNATDVSRILVSDRNAFSKYEDILEQVRVYGKNKLVLAVIGPTATVLAYDLAKEGYWVIDIGQLDVEYEWYLRGVDERCDIPYKQVSEVLQYRTIQTDESQKFIKRYKSEIIAKVL